MDPERGLRWRSVDPGGILNHRSVLSDHTLPVTKSMTTLLSSYGQYRPILTLSTLFILWKAIIALIVLTAPGIGYDTSTSLLFSNNTKQNVVSDLPQSLPSAWLKFVRWDDIYFTHMAQHGHVFEQEWAFGIGLSTTTSWIARCMSANLDITVFANTIQVSQG